MKSLGSLQLSGKHNLINKDNSTIVLVSALTVGVVVFSIVAAMSLIDRMSYQNKVVGLKQNALATLKDNVKKAEQLETAFTSWNSANESILGTNDKNSKIILDALPSDYDYPALTSSIAELANSAGVRLTAIEGTDDEINAQKRSVNPQVVEIPLTVSFSGSYASIQKLINDIQRSIRPISIQKVEFSGTDKELTAKLDVKTYYQPAIFIDIEQKVVPGDKSSKSTADAKSKSETSSPQAENVSGGAQQ